MSFIVAIDTCAAQGGGTVLLESDTFLAGGLYLKSSVTLEISISAILKASGDIRDYKNDTHHIVIATKQN